VNEQNVDQMLKGYVKDAGGDPDAIAACVAKPETAKRVADAQALGEKLGIASTPTFLSTAAESWASVQTFPTMR